MAEDDGDGGDGGGGGRRRAVLIAGGLLALLVVAALVVWTTRDDGDETATTVPEPLDEPSEEEGTVPGLTFLPEDPDGPGEPAPLTGLPVDDPAVLARPLLAVKVDNLDTPSESARPQAGLAAADVVVEEVVEGGITRFVVLLHSTDADRVGPVRSARTTDVQLLPAFGSPLFAFSGGNAGVLDAVRSSPWIVDRGGEGPPAYTRDPDRRAPHDLFLAPAELWADPGAATPPRPLAEMQPRGTEPTGGEAVEGLEIDHPGAASAPVRWEWEPAVSRWVRYQSDTVQVDADGYAVGPRNVIVLTTETRPSPADSRSPEAITVGSGEAWILTGGQAVVGRWERASEADPFRFLDGAGDPVPLTQGRTWIELVSPGDATLVR